MRIPARESLSGSLSLEQVWAAPPLDGPATGGTLYNASLLRALAARGVKTAAISLDELRKRLAAQAQARYWVDSLFLDSALELRRANVARAPLGLVMHFLPSFVRLGKLPRRDELDAAEKTALDVADAFLVPSPFMRDALVSLGAFPERVITAAPGVDVSGARVALRRDVRRSTLSALMIANALPGKGIVPFLKALAPLSGTLHFELSIVGELTVDAAYAAECRAAAEAPSLLSRIQFVGPLTHEAVLQRLRDADVLVSASRMESFGMALAEARALGVPVLALRGGHAEAHVDPFAGGEAVSTDQELAAAFIRIAEDAEERMRRKACARAERTTRSWDDTATDFLDGLRALEEATGPDSGKASGLLVRP